MKAQATDRRTAWVALVCCLGCLIALAPSARADETAGLRVGYTIEGVDFGARLTRKDLEAATEILLREMLREHTELIPKFRIFETTDDLVAAVEAREIDFVEIHPLAYFRLPEESRERIKPGLLVQYGESRLERFVLLGRPGTSVSDAAGLRLRSYRGRDRGIGELWLERVLLKASLPAMSKHFGAVESFPRAEQVLLPTFFGKSDLCLVVEGDYKVAVELNPQIGERLVPIDRSPGVPFVIAGATDSVSSEQAEELNGVIAPSVGSDPGGRQALALLGVKQLCKILPGDLDGLAAIVAGSKPAEARSATAIVEREEP